MDLADRGDRPGDPADRPGASTRFAACWYTAAGSGSSFTMDVNLTDGKAHAVSVYALDWLDGGLGGRDERIDVINPATGSVLDTRTITGFGAGEYLTWSLSGHVQIRVTNLATNPGNNAVISGLFFGSGTPGSASLSGRQLDHAGDVEFGLWVRWVRPRSRGRELAFLRPGHALGPE